MLFADPRANAVGFLILRHLYDGDVIEWPIEEEHPEHPLFAALEEQGFIARWDRIWPLRDRYRLTEKGIAAIETFYRPAGADAFFDELRRANLDPAGRRGYLQARGFDPSLWPVLHDPSAHWSTFGSEGSLYQQYVWEDQRPAKRTRHSSGGGGRSGGGVHHHYHQDRYPDIVPQVVDLDRQAQDPGVVGPNATDYDVS